MTASASTFDTAEPLLLDLLKNIATGSIQLPDFQRGWVWDDDHICALLASVTLSYPIGAIMLLEAGEGGARFLPRLVEGVKLVARPAPSSLILDGQQRLTSLFLAFMSNEPVPTRTAKKQDILSIFFLDMQKCLDPDIDRLEAVVSLRPQRLVTENFGRDIVLDVRSREQEYDLGMIPIGVLLHQTAFFEWRNGYQEHFNFDPDKSKFLNNFHQHVVNPLLQYKVPVIELLKSTPKEAVCQVFENVNQGGVSLTVFELMTATYAADDFRLRQDWDARSERLHRHEALKAFDGTAFLTATTLLASYKRSQTGDRPVGCKRRDVLNLPLDQFEQNAPLIENGLVRAAQLLHREQIHDTRGLPYGTQLVPLAAICAALGDRFHTEPVKDRIAQWYWCGVFGELYGGSTETRFAFDLPEVLAWIDGGETPRTVRDGSFDPLRLLGLQSRQSAAYKGLMARLMLAGSRDFLSGDPLDLTNYVGLAIDIHHVFPRHYCEGQGIDVRKWNSVVNKAPLSARTNQIIGGHSPSTYLDSLERNHGISAQRLDEILRSHLIEPSLIRSDAFDMFLRHRASHLLDVVEQATGKVIQGRDSAEVVREFGGPLIDMTLNT